VIALDPHQQWIAAAGGAGLVTLWRTTGKETLLTLRGNVLSSVESLAVSPDGQTLAAGCADGTIKLWTIPDLATAPVQKQFPIRTLSAHSGSVSGLCFSEGERQLLYSAGVDGSIKLWQPGQTEAIARLSFPLGEDSRRRGIFSLRLTPNGQGLIAGGDNGIIQIWQ